MWVKFRQNGHLLAVRSAFAADRVRDGDSAACLLPPCHGQPRFLLDRLEPRRRYQVFVLRRAPFARAEPGDLMSADAVPTRGKFDACRFLRMYALQSSGRLRYSCAGVRSLGSHTGANWLSLELISRRCYCGKRQQRRRERDRRSFSGDVKGRSEWRTVLFHGGLGGSGAALSKTRKPSFWRKRLREFN